MRIRGKGGRRKRELEEERIKKEWKEHRQVGIQDKRDPFTNLMDRFLKEGTGNCVQTASV